MSCRFQRNETTITLAFIILLWTASDVWALTASPSAITFQAVQGASNPASQTASLSTSAATQVKWIVFDNATWLMVSPASGAFTGTTPLTMTVNAAGLAAGTYSATVTVQTDIAGTISIPVILTVASPQTSGSSSPPPPASPPPPSSPPPATSPPPPPPATSSTPVLAASPSAITFRAVQGSNPPSQTAGLSASSTSQVNWIAYDNATWLMESPASGAFTSATQLSMIANSAGLAVGTYSAMVTIQSDKAGNISIPVTLIVSTTQTSGSTSPPPPSSPPPAPSSNTTATLTWSPVSSSNLAGYKVYVGTASGRYGTPITVGNVTSYVINNLTLGNTYYFVVTSYSSSGAESAYSNEVSKSIY